MSRQTHQIKGQSLEQFLGELRLEMCLCNFGVRTGSLVRDHIVDGFWNDRLREHLLGRMTWPSKKQLESAKLHSSQQNKQEGRLINT